ncbi:uncharacterized protein LOC112555734 isoform X2 [Pomacea canaliculata]|nr:uncharacterized protein LOC112555734 isoform X2 [Pomacea canaliculata]
MAESNAEDWTGTELQEYYGPTHHLDKRYLDSLASDLFKRDFDENGDEVGVGKRREETAEPLFSDASFGYYLQTMPSKRYLDSLAGDIFKRYFNPYVWANLKRNPYRRFPSRTYLDSLAGDLLKRDAHKRRKRYADLQTSELFKRKHHRIMPGWFLDAYPVLTYGVGDTSSKDDETATTGDVKPLTSKRFIDSIASHLLKKRSLEDAALTLDDDKLTADDVISVSKRYLDTLASDLLD